MDPVENSNNEKSKSDSILAGYSQRVEPRKILRKPLPGAWSLVGSGMDEHPILSNVLKYRTCRQIAHDCPRFSVF
jgi:hypothetical protein